MKALSLALLLGCLIGLSACSSHSRSLDDKSSDAADDNTIEITGEIRRISLEGGAWIIQADDSTRYQPLNLGEQYQEDGLKVHIIAEKKPDRMSFLQIGPIVEIKSIEKR